MKTDKTNIGLFKVRCANKWIDEAKKQTILIVANDRLY